MDLNSTSTVAITTFNHAHYLSSAIESCLRQTTVNEIIVIDDGSTDDPASVVARYPNVRIISQENRGLAAARNRAITATDTNFITFLDADDRLLPDAMEIGVEHLRSHPNALMTYGAHRMINGVGEKISEQIYYPVLCDPYLQFLQHGNFIGMHATVVYRRKDLLASGGFDENFRSCEDYECFMRIAKVGSIISHKRLVAEYRRHEKNMSNNSPAMLAAALRALDLQLSSGAAVTVEARAAIAAGRIFWRDYYSTKSPTVRGFKGQRWLAKAIPLLGRLMPEEFWVPSVGNVRLGDFARTRPISKSFGFDRGQPIDRYYIENFLSQCSGDIRGRVLEIGDDGYTRRFGGTNVFRSDVLHVDASCPGVTIVGDLSQSDVLPLDTFDCIILTQTLHLIYDMQKAITNLAASLKEDGVMIVTVPGISSIDREEWKDSWYWSLTELALAKLIAQSFDPRDFFTLSFGNVFAAVCFLQGLCRSEVPTAKLDVSDAAYPVVIGARVVKRLH